MARDRTVTREPVSGDDARADELRYARTMLALLCATLVITALNGGLLSVSLPVVVRHFDASAIESTWLLLGSMLASTSLIIAFGRLADMYGRVPIFMGGLVVMTVTAVLAGFSPGVRFLIVILMAQAIGIAMLLSVMAAMLTVVTPPDRLSKSMGLYMSSLASASLAGPALGAMLADTAGWRWLFWFTGPFGVALIIWAVATIRPMPVVGERGKLDIPGVLLVAAVLSGILLALSRLQVSGLTSPIVLLGFGMFLIGLPVLVIVEGRVRYPLVDFKLFRTVSVAASNSAILFANMARMAVVLMGGLYFQAVEGDSPLEAAFKVLPLPLATTIAGLMMGMVSKWGSQHAIATTGAAILGAGTVLLLFAFGGGMSYPVLCLGFVIAGFGGGIFTPANTTAILQEVPPGRLGVINAVRMMLMSAGGLLSTALALALMTSALPPELRSAVFAGNMSTVAEHAIDELRAGYVRAIAALIGLSVLATIAAYIGQRANNAKSGRPAQTEAMPSPAASSTA